MGDPKFSRRKFNRPSHPWKGERIRAEGEITRKFGLKNKREIWKASYRLKNYRRQARELLAITNPTDHQNRMKSHLINHLSKHGMLTPQETDLGSVLALGVENILSRRLQSQVYYRGLATTQKQARQLIVHGHISVDGKKVTVPGRLIRIDEEEKITYHGSSPLTNDLHPIRSAGSSSSSVAVIVTTPDEEPVEAAPETTEAAAEAEAAEEVVEAPAAGGDEA